MGLKKLLIFIAAVLAAVVVVDIVLGLSVRSYVKSHEMPGDYRSLDYLLKDFDNDALILGSSVALNSLDPVAMGDSLGLDVFNGASNGQSLAYQLAVLKTVLQKHVPKVVLLGLIPTDLATEGPGPRINLLSPYYGLGYASIDSVLECQSKASKVFMRSSLIRLNTIWFRILLYHVIEPGVKGQKGFIAKEIPSVFPTKDKLVLENKEMSEQRRAELSEIISLCKSHGIDLVVFFPPQYVDLDADLHETPLYRETAQILAENGMTLYDDFDSPVFLNDSSLFYDNNHLNKNGAEIYTEYFINRIENDSIL